ncbi:hypothetical protein CYMTET_20895 [Cymbomonas tetramitiformis]|uniref:Uncharacterized protein n=1 Tax=Cymbomonas tetramitiformis TaxID=36881 RepID=A0AAE0L3J3_9CHLO|nr:hypothetical protein CYMTET_20895 [Cymbomonas tetramitiformis]
MRASRRSLADAVPRSPSTVRKRGTQGKGVLSGRMLGLMAALILLHVFQYMKGARFPGGDLDATRPRWGSSEDTLLQNISLKTEKELDVEAEDDSPQEEAINCAANIASTYLLKANEGMERTRTIPVTHLAPVFTFSKRWQYSHMPTLEYIANPKASKHVVMAAAWQAAPSVHHTDGSVKVAVEGLSEQRLLFSLSVWHLPPPLP